MKNQQKKRILQKLWGWISLSINCFVISFHLTGQYEDLRNSAMLLSALPVCYGALKTQIDKVKGDMSVITIVIEYLGVYIITFVLGFKIAEELVSISVLITLVIVTFIEILLFLIITCWNFLRGFLMKTTSQITKNKNT